MSGGAGMEWIIGLACLFIGAGLGAGVTLGISKGKPGDVRIIEKTIEVDRSLTSADLLKIPCGEDYMKEYGESLCREMFCRMNTRSGNQSNTASSQECETISNLINTKVIMKACAKDEACERLFEKRK